MVVKRKREHCFDKQWKELELPNYRSPHHTPASLKIDLRYARLQIYDRWTYDRFLRLANFLNLTLYELASLACIPHHRMEGFERRNRLMAGGARDYSAALVLTLLEAHVAREYTHDVIANPFPDLNKAAATPPENALPRDPEI